MIKIPSGGPTPPKQSPIPIWYPPPHPSDIDSREQARYRLTRVDRFGGGLEMEAENRRLKRDNESLQRQVNRSWTTMKIMMVGVFLMGVDVIFTNIIRMIW